jgi:class 3 adenylate cyclase
MEKEPLERKLVTILYADVAGYSRLTGEDEEGTHRTLSAYLDAITHSIERHNGKVLHYAGDAVLAEFASVVHALTCATNIQADVKKRNENLAEERKLQFRIGVNLGDVKPRRRAQTPVSYRRESR